MEDGIRYEDCGRGKWSVPIQVCIEKSAKVGHPQWPVEFLKSPSSPTEMGEGHDGQYNYFQLYPTMGSSVGLTI